MRRDLLQSLTLTLLQAGRVWRRAADEVVTAYGLTEATALPLLLIGRLGGDLRQTTLADALGVEGPSLVRLLDQLCEAGLVTRREDPTDRRAKVLHLTPEGLARAAAIEARFDALREAVFGTVDDDDLRAALRVLRALQGDGSKADGSKADGFKGSTVHKGSTVAAVAHDEAAPALRVNGGERS